VDICLFHFSKELSVIVQSINKFSRRSSFEKLDDTWPPRFERHQEPHPVTLFVTGYRPEIPFGNLANYLSSLVIDSPKELCFKQIGFFQRLGLQSLQIDLLAERLRSLSTNLQRVGAAVPVIRAELTVDRPSSQVEFWNEMMSHLTRWSTL